MLPCALHSRPRRQDVQTRRDVSDPWRPSSVVRRPSSRRAPTSPARRARSTRVRCRLSERKTGLKPVRAEATEFVARSEVRYGKKSKPKRPRSHTRRIRSRTPSTFRSNVSRQSRGSQSVSYFTARSRPARSPLHRLAVRLRHSQSNTTSTDSIAPGGYSKSQNCRTVRSTLSQRTGCSLSLLISVDSAATHRERRRRSPGVRWRRARRRTDYFYRTRTSTTKRSPVRLPVPTVASCEGRVAGTFLTYVPVPRYESPVLSVGMAV